MRVMWLLGLAVACGCAPAQRQTWANSYAGDGEDFFATDDDFVCLGDANFEVVNGTRVANFLDHQREAVEVAGAGTKSRNYPVGTLVQLFANEAMIKRGNGFFAASGDWEFFQLDVDSGRTVITNRGTTDVNNAAGNCLQCHSAAEQFDYTCFTNHTCGDLPFFIDQDVDPKTDDARCSH